ncbi:MAG: hypothetical protein WC323_02105 [Patescibacteria group bacterium]|jgi:hypothetical protein
MRLTINSNQLPENPATFLRRAGYAHIHDRNTGKDSFVRRLTGNFYPRLHCYIFDQGGQITFNLHLDQRPTRYDSQRAHAGEYDSSIVREELERLQSIINNQGTKNNNNESFNDVVEEKKGKKWWPF